MARNSNQHGSEPDIGDLVQRDAPYQQLVDSFSEQAVARAGERKGDPAFASRYSRAIAYLLDANREAIDEFQQVSIEQILLRTLVLAAIKWDPLGFIVEPFARDPASDAREHRAWCSRFITSMLPCVNAKHAWSVILEECLAGVHDATTQHDEATFIELLAFREHHFHTHRTVHLSLMPALNEIQTDDRPLNANLWFWCPADESFGLIVECAGFETHPREGPNLPVELPENVRALRFPGIDVVRDPVSICGEILSSLGTT